LLSGNSSINGDNTVVKEITKKVNGNLEEKFGLSSSAASSVSGGLIPQILGGLVNKAKDTNYPEFNMNDIVNAISSGQGGELMNSVSKYGKNFGLDQNNDGKVDINDAMAAVTKKGGLGGLLGKLFGK
jgi:mevalonate kinase